MVKYSIYSPKGKYMKTLNLTQKEVRALRYRYPKISIKKSKKKKR